MNISVSWQQVGALSGVIASVLIVTGMIVGDLNALVPVVSPSSTIATTFVAHRTKILISTYLSLLGVFFLMGFLAYLRAFLLDTTGEQNWLASVAFGGGLVACAMLLLAAHFNQAFTVLSDYGAETQIAKTLYVLDWNDYLLVEAPALAALVGATTATGFTYRVFPRWLNWWGALLTLVLLGPVLPGSGVMVTFLWVAALSVLLLLKVR